MLLSGKSVAKSAGGALLVAIMATTSTSALAQSTYYKGWDGQCGVFKSCVAKGYSLFSGDAIADDFSKADEPLSAPEIDGGQAGIALGLLASIMLMIRERRRSAGRKLSQ